MRLLHPLHSASTSTLTVSASLEADDLRIRRAGTAIRDDQLRVVEAALRGALHSSGGMQYSASLQLRQGLDDLGAGLDAADLVDDQRRVDFLVTQLQFTALRRFAQRWSARFDAFAQYSGHELPDSERFKIGGDRLGRGFEVAEIAGDRGLGGKLDLRRDLLDAGGLAGRISAYGFYDIGAAWKRNQSGREYAATSGLGLAMAGTHLTGYLEVAAPVSGVDVEGRRSPSVFVEMSWRF
jgi:hemolysin activation/secretion protein